MSALRRQAAQRSRATHCRFLFPLKHMVAPDVEASAPSAAKEA
jgi:hypothetical protein